MPVHDWTAVPAGLFHGFHLMWIARLTAALNAGLLPPGYRALPEQDIGAYEADVLTLHATASATQGAEPEFDRPSPLVQTPPRTRFTTTLPQSRRRRRPRSIVIRHVSGRRIVAIIEIVSPSNKGSKNDVRAFVDKIANLIEQGIHVLVLDLFPPGKRDPRRIHGLVCDIFGETPPELPANEPLTLASYVGHPIQTAYLETLAVGDSLPDMPLYLLPEWHISVPLEKTYEEAGLELGLGNDDLLTE